MEHLRNIGAELSMVSNRNIVHIVSGDFWKVHPSLWAGQEIWPISRRQFCHQPRRRWMIWFGGQIQR
ncbi:MAG: hypothetical protein U5N55_12190 [Cypionkella sp.]|nr:hypothetical protein [Cypionkella sp.]